MAGPRGSPLVVALGLAVLLAPTTALGKVINVMMSKDSSDGSCPGPTCNMRAAWMAARLNDTIMLDVNPVMSSSLGPLTAPGWANTLDNGTVVITGPKGGAVVRGGSKFISMDYYPYSRGELRWQVVRLVLRNIEFTGFNYISTDGEYTGGMVVCLSSGGQVWCNPPARGDTPRVGGLHHPLKGSQQAKGPLGGQKAGLLGSEDTKFGNWSLLRAIAMLEVDNCIFRHNTYRSVSRDNSYGSVIATHIGGTSVLPVIISSSQFMDNTVTGVSSASGTVYGPSGGGFNALMVSDSRFANNNDMATGNGGLISGLDGPTIGSIGPISISGSSFVGNKLGGSRSIVSATSDYHYHVYIQDTYMSENEGNIQTANPNAAAIIAGWLVMERVSLSLPAAAPLTATSVMNDQYMAGCAVSSTTGKPVLFTGYQVFNRNPIFTNANNGTTTLGFADCSQSAPWLPCHKGTICSDVHNSDGDRVGYSCA